MFPIGDDNSELTRTSYVTWALIAINVLVFIYEVSLGEGLQSFIVDWGTIPREIVAGKDLQTLLSSMFLHGGFGHILGNMMFLKVFGDNVEDRLGHIPFLIFYLVTGLAASLAHVALNPNSPVPSVGASGAISGVLGAYIVMFHRNRVRVLLGYFVTEVPAWAMIGFWALQQFVATYLGTMARTEETNGGGVAYAAHAGGFLAGVLLALVMGRRGSGMTRDPAARYR